MKELVTETSSNQAMESDASANCEIISRETIKPSSPTPQHKRIFNLSWFDQVSPRHFVPILLFFDKTTHPINTHLLKTSLSQTLSNYYPFAGRLRDRHSILCNDQGVDFLEAKLNVPLSSLLQNPTRESLDALFPDKLHWRYAEGLTSLLAVQVTHFRCGGFAVSVCASHKLADAATLVTFVNSWASVARNGLAAASASLPALDAAAELFPPGGDLPLLPEPTGPHWAGSCATRRFVFCAEKVGFLKAVSPGSTRVEAVTALLYKTAIRASKAVSGSADSHVLLHQVNLRSRTVPKLPENAFGSVAWCFPVVAPEGSQIREALTRFCGAYFERFTRGHEEWFLAMTECFEESKASMKRSGNQAVYSCTSWCRFPVYEVDFGWGNPVWATSAGTVDKNVVILMDTKRGDGIEAIVTLDEQEMFAFECDQDLLQFASLLS